MSPLAAIGFVNAATQAGAPATTVSTNPADPMPRRVAVPPEPPVMMSPAVVIGFENPAGTAAHFSPSVCVLSAVRTNVFAPTPRRCSAVPSSTRRSPFVVAGLVSGAEPLIVTTTRLSTWKSVMYRSAYAPIQVSLSVVFAPIR